MRTLNSLFLTLFIFAGATAQAGDLQWAGTYRAEGVGIKNSELDGNENKAYMLHHLVLRPTITAFDGFTIYSRFDIMNSSNTNFPTNQLGQYFGSGVNATPGTAGTNANNSNTLSGNVRSDTLAVNELYMTYAVEYGVLTVGRAPVHFGLGITYNNGHGPFDHWFDNKDMVAFKFVTGNFFVMPAIAKNVEGNLGSEDEVNDYMIQIQYESPESESIFGAFYKARRSNTSSNDSPGAPVFGDAAVTSNTLGSKLEDYNIYFTQKMDDFKIAVEMAFSSGKSGVKTNDGSEVSINGQAMIMEASWLPKESHWNSVLKLGYVSGDDPNTPNVYEGYLIDPNYDIAFLMMNHKMGQYDVFRTSYFNNTSPAVSASNLPDVEVISNAMFVSANTGYKFNEKWETKANLAWANLQQAPVVGASKSAGFELDLELHFVPIKGIKWINRAGMMFPGDAFKGVNSQFNNGFAYGLETKAAISF